MGESRRGRADGGERSDRGPRSPEPEPKPERRGPESNSERQDPESNPERRDPETAYRPDGTRLARLGDRLGIGALGRLSWRRRWVGGQRPWRVSAAAFPREGNLTEKAQFLLQYAVLAPSSHNTQPWLFTVADDEIRLFADLNRWLRVADHDKRELYLGLGAALENLLVAADHFGLASEVRYLPGSDATHAATVLLSEDDAAPSEDADSRLFEAIPRRRTNRGEYEKRPIPSEELQALREVVTEGREHRVTLQFVADPVTLDEMATLTARANRRLFADPAYRRELARWVGRGAFGQSWPKAKVGAVVVRHLNVGRQRARSDARLLRNAPVVAVLRTETDGPEARIRAGQAFQRASLLATARGVQTHPISALLQVSALRRELADLLGNSDSPPQHLFRLGYAEDASASAPSPRRPVNAVLVD